jgi:hypothetical protein
LLGILFAFLWALIPYPKENVLIALFR